MRRAQVVAALGAVVLGGSGARGAFVGPYTPDADTLHLWHMDDSSGPALDSVGALHLSNVDQSAEPANAAGGNTPATANVTFGNAAYTGMGAATNFANNALIPAVVNTGSQSTSPQRPILIGGTALSTADTTDAVPFTFVNPSTGAFTWEATVKFDSSFDPTNAAYRIGGATSPGNVGGGYPMEIISGEGDANAHRNWQFRIDQVNIGQATNPGTGIGVNGAGVANTGNTDLSKPRIEFANLHGIGSGTNSNQAIAINIPTSGPNALSPAAVAAGDWFHIAVEFNGSANTPDNVLFYWTDISNPANASLTAPNFLGSAQMTNAMLTAVANNPDFAIGNEARDAGSGAGEGESFVGSIDEVRMSQVVRYPNPVPEPASLGLIALAGLRLAARRRRR